MMPAKALDLVMLMHTIGRGRSTGAQVTVIDDYRTREEAQKVARAVAEHLGTLPVMHIDERTETQCYRVEVPHILVEVGWL